MSYATPYESINSGCTSFLLPIGCSGLAVLSKYPIVEVEIITGCPKKMVSCVNYSQQHGTIFLGHRVAIFKKIADTIFNFQAKLVPFTHRGNFWRFDGEIFVRKGVGVARILWNEKTIDVFTTHMVSYLSKVRNMNFRCT